MPPRDNVVIGALAGGVEALVALIRSFPPFLPAAVFVVVHLPMNRPSVFAQILTRAGPVPCAFARRDETIQRGRMYIAPANRHLLIAPGYVRVEYGPRGNRHRPSVDVLFRTAAFAYGPMVVGVVLTGALDDGTAGLQSVKRHQGIAVVQAPYDALIPSMPRSALESVEVDYCLQLAEIAPLPMRLASDPVEKNLASGEGNMAIGTLLRACILNNHVDNPPSDALSPTSIRRLMRSNLLGVGEK